MVDKNKKSSAFSCHSKQATVSIADKWNSSTYRCKKDQT